MAKKINSLSALSDEFKTRMAKAVQMTRDDIYDAFHTYIFTWYSDYQPKSYKRSYKFLNSLVKLDVNIIGNKVFTSVKIDEDFLGSQYSTGNHPTGMNVAEAADLGLHGAVGGHFLTRPGYSGVRFWADAFDALGREEGIRRMLLQNLKKCF